MEEDVITVFNKVPDYSELTTAEDEDVNNPKNKKNSTKSKNMKNSADNIKIKKKSHVTFYSLQTDAKRNSKRLRYKEEVVTDTEVIVESITPHSPRAFSDPAIGDKIKRRIKGSCDRPLGNACTIPVKKKHKRKKDKLLRTAARKAKTNEL